MPPASIAVAGERVNQSRRQLGDAVRRLEATLTRPSSLLTAAAVGALAGFSLERLGTAGVARALSLYVRYRTYKAILPRQDGTMSKTTPQMRTLRLALEDCDGEADLARLLGVTVQVLSGWLSGQDAVPTTIYVRALDLVATGR